MHTLADNGWEGTKDEELSFNWKAMRNNVQNYIKGINFSYVTSLSEKNIDYINARAYFKDQNTVQFEYKENLFDPKTTTNTY